MVAATHGLTRINGVQNPAYVRWLHVRQRCYNPRNGSFKNYGGRGIGMCDRWRGSFADFLADVGPRPSPDHTLDRIDNNGNYEPGNVRWATASTQARNSRRAKITLEQAERIRAMYAQGCWSYRTLSAHLGVSFPTVQFVINNRTWKV